MSPGREITVTGIFLYLYYPGMNFNQSIETVTGHGTIHNTHGVADQDISGESFYHIAAVENPQSRTRTIVTINEDFRNVSTWEDSNTSCQSDVLAKIN